MDNGDRRGAGQEQDKGKGRWRVEYERLVCVCLRYCNSSGTARGRDVCNDSVGTSGKEKAEVELQG